MSRSDIPLLELRHVVKSYAARQGFFDSGSRYITALYDVSLVLYPGKILGLVGESGSGKSTLARIAVGLEPPDSGEILFHGKDISAIDQHQFRRQIQMIFQDPFSSLNPKKTIFQIIATPLKIHNLCPHNQLRDRVAHLLTEAGLSPDVMNRYPHQFSGGQRQRIGLARALALSPELIIADEPTSALDVSIQAQIINLFIDLHQKHGLGFLFISHDLPLVEFVSDIVAVMYQGRIVEIMPQNAFMRSSDDDIPHHPYTDLLFRSIPIPDPDQHILINDPVPNPDKAVLPWEDACAFANRCPHAEDICRKERPAMREVAPLHKIACHIVA